MSDVLNIDDDTNEGITESADDIDDKREYNGQNDDIEEYNQIC